MNDTHRKGHMYIFRTMSNRQPQRKSVEATGVDAGDKNKENVTPEIKEEAGGPKNHCTNFLQLQETGKMHKKNARP